LADTGRTIGVVGISPGDMTTGHMGAAIKGGDDSHQVTVISLAKDGASESENTIVNSGP
jgi:hypothetical protein